MKSIIRKLRQPWLIMLIVLTLTVPVAVQAAVPGQISYQGKLTDDTGVPVADDTYTIKFSLYDASSLLLWSETQTTVEVEDGVFNVQIGQDPGSNPLPPFDGEMFLGIQVGTDAEMTPRQPLASVPFAFKAGDADTLDGLMADDFADAGHDHDFGDINGLVDDGQVPDSITIDHAAEADFAFDAGQLDGQDASDFALAGHDHSFASIYDQASDGQIPDDITIDFAAVAGNADNLGGLPAGAYLNSASDYGRSGVAGNLYEGAQTLTDRYLNDDRAETLQADTPFNLLSVVQLGSGMAVDASSAGAITIRGESSSGTGAGVAGYGSGLNGVGVFGQGGDKGVHGYISNVNGGYAVYGEAANSNAIGVYGTGPGWAGYFDGDLYAGGNVGIGTTAPSDKLHVVGDLKVAGNDGWSTNGDEAIVGLGNILGHFYIKAVYGDGLKLGAYATTDAFVLKQLSGNVGIGTASPTSKLDVNGTTTTKVLAITGGADIAEPFDIKAGDAVVPGMVLTIDAEHPGKLKPAEKAYDRCVAGIVSAAGGIQPGMIMSQTGTLAEGEVPIALTGRVYCWADAGNNAIRPGDLLTTSDTLGHAMKATDYARSQGAVLGKAMTALEDGKGLVLVLVSLQ